MALTDLALEDLPEGSPVRGHLEQVIAAAERSQDLIEQILAYSRKTALAADADCLEGGGLRLRWTCCGRLCRRM